MLAKLMAHSVTIPLHDMAQYATAWSREHGEHCTRRFGIERVRQFYRISYLHVTSCEYAVKW